LSSLKDTTYIPVRKYVALFTVLFVGAVLFLFEHYNEEPFETGLPQAQKSFDQEKAEPGFLAPKFFLKNLQGNYDGPENYKGKVVILNFWATWCAPCRIEMPSFENLYRRYRSEGLVVLAVSIDKDAEAKIRSFVDMQNLSFPVLLDSAGEAEKLYPSFSIPFTYVIDKTGRVVARVDGAKNWESKETFEAVEHLLKQS